MRSEASSISADAFDVVSLSGSGGRRGDDAGKKIEGRERHAPADTDGRVLVRIPPHPGERIAEATPIKAEIVRKIADQIGFVPPSRRVVERYLGRRKIGAGRRLRDARHDLDDGGAIAKMSGATIFVPPEREDVLEAWSPQARNAAEPRTELDSE